VRGVAALCTWPAISCVIALALGFNGLERTDAIVALMGGAVVGCLTAFKWPPEQPKKLRPVGMVVLGIYCLAVLRAFFWLIYPDNDQLKILSPHNLGDLSLHLALIRYFASGISFWPASPILVGEPLTYPPAADLANSLLLLAGVDWRVGLILVGILFGLCGAWALWRYGGTFTVAALLFGGGLSGFAIFRTWELVEFSRDDTWKNAFLTMVVPQRGFLFSLPMGLVLLDSWRSEFFGGPRRCPLVVQVLLYSTLPLFQVHTFLALSAALALAFMIKPSRGPLTLAGLALLPATVFMLLVTGMFQRGGAMRLDPLWSFGDGGVLGFILEFGPALGACIAALIIAWKLKEPKTRWLTSIAAVLAAIGFLVPLNDWDWDNTKILVWAWLAAAPAIWQLVLLPLPYLPRIALLLALFFTGALSLAGGLDRRHGYELARRNELAKWEQATRNLPAETVFAAPPSYNHPLLLLGRRMVCGYEGHLSSHGLDYQATLRKLHQILRREGDWQKAAESLGVDYVVESASLLGIPKLVPLVPIQHPDLKNPGEQKQTPFQESN